MFTSKKGFTENNYTDLSKQKDQKPCQHTYSYPCSATLPQIWRSVQPSERADQCNKECRQVMFWTLLNPKSHFSLDRANSQTACSAQKACIFGQMTSFTRFPQTGYASNYPHSQPHRTVASPNLLRMLRKSADGVAKEFFEIPHTLLVLGVGQVGLPEF